MRIAMIAPLFEPVPPPLYGGTERIVSTLTEELVARGHDVTLFASGDSCTSAHLVPTIPRAIRLAELPGDHTPWTLAAIGEAYAAAGDFDLIHSHIDFYAFPAAANCSTPTLSTMHGRLDIPHLRRLTAVYHHLPLVSISDSQRLPLPDAHWVGTVPNALDPRRFTFRPEPGNYLVFIGRISPEKRVDRAIEIARDLDMPLIIAAKVDDVWDGEYYRRAIAPMIALSPQVEYIGEVSDAEKDDLLGGALACLFPIDWPEPFGITMIESMATGTPVIAMRHGAVPEVMVDGVTGFICESFGQMVDGVRRIQEIDRAACRRHVEEHFSATLMAERYERLYARLLTTRQASIHNAGPPLGMTPAPHRSDHPQKQVAYPVTKRGTPNGNPRQ